MHHIHFDTVDSTNSFAKALLNGKKGKTEPLLITADTQTAGRGRTGNSFSSLKGNGLYMTVVLPMSDKPENCLFITLAAAVAVTGVLREAGCSDVEIKWVNDLYSGGKKICGILTEAVTDPETGIMKYAVIGIGINIDANIRLMPEELWDTAGTLKNLPVTNEVLALRIADALQRFCRKAMTSQAGREEVLSRYRSLSLVLGREVSWKENGKWFFGMASEIDEQGKLIVDTASGQCCLDSGEISVRLTRK